MDTRPLLNFAAGYVQRALDELPRQGTRSPWQLAMSVKTDVRVLRDGPVDDRNLHFSRASQAGAEPMHEGADVGAAASAAA